MRILVTGLRGTVGQALQNYLHSLKHEVYGWPREEIPIDNYLAMESYIQEIAPDVLFHLAAPSKPTGKPNENWLVHYEWSSELAWITHRFGIRFLYTSTVQVFSDTAKGPFTIQSEPDNNYGYGYEKRMAEQRILYQNPQAFIARLGWQIGYTTEGNHMAAYLEQKNQKEGKIFASTRWLPAASFLEDTVKALWEIVEKHPPGIYLLDSNRGWNFYQIATALKKLLRKKWTIIPDENFVYDQRMIDDRVVLPPLSVHLKHLPKI
ncbi:sugar nucleotide-binding protein [Thermospira aquatica]|uniref:dTDP-4-dehydrorhamnose reductase n=1 Tax=Thermospira aquatica TaxID=2828656 RepID=A0AAX3BFB5_9SPIR|nr:sugar nucleotide-binding protein [Thermospira aquatica]URA10823.1 sugar nucleotide-binding protein [Thermospira aquatica]